MSEEMKAELVIIRVDWPSVLIVNLPVKFIFTFYYFLITDHACTYVFIISLSFP